MFDTDLDDLSTADLLTAAAEYAHDQEHAEVGILRTTLAFADRNAVVEWPGRDPLPGYERLRVYGGEGCPGVAEFAPIELGAVLGISSGAASSLIGEALALRHRLPRVWAAVLSGNAVAWRARKIAHACLSLSIEAAAIVDRRVAGIVNTLTPGRLKKIVTAAMWQADPEQAQAAAEAAAKTRGVFVAQSDPDDDHGTKRIFIRAATGAVIRFEATVEDVAQALNALGDTDTLDERRAKAIDWLSDPAAADHLLQIAHHLAHTTHPDHREPTPTNEHPAITNPREQPEPPEQEPPEPSEPSHDHVAMDEDPVPADHDERNEWYEQDEWYERDEQEDPTADPTDDTASPDSEPGTASACADDGRYDTGNADIEYDADDADIAELSDLTDAYDADGAGDAFGGGHIGEPDAASAGQDFTRLALADTLEARLAAIKHDAYSNGRDRGSKRRQHTLYVHLTDKTLATGTGILRVEELGPLLASQLTELLGHDQVILKPVIDLHDQVSVDSYEIPDRIRERVRLRHPVDMFPYGAAEATPRTDLDHITPYDRTGPPGQTRIDNLIPQSRLHHRAKTFGGWSNRRLPTGAIEWISPHGFRFLVDHTGTRPLPRRQPADRQPTHSRSRGPGSPSRRGRRGKPGRP